MRFILTYGGSVGIGSASPTQKLTVAGNINKSNSWIASDAVWGANTFEIHNNSWDGVSNGNYGGITGGHGYYYGGLQSGGGGGNEAASGEFYVSGKSMLMGNVGVGTTGPNFKMDIQQDITMSGDINPGTAQLSVGGTSTVGKRMLMGYDTNGNGFGFIKSGNYGVTWTPLALQPNGGNVGIGTSSPGFKLHVPSGYIGTDYINTSDNSVASGVTGVMVKAGDNYLRTGTAAAVTSFLNSNNGWIQNQYGGEQSANYWISGTGNVGKLKFKGEGGNSGIGLDYYAIYQEAGAWSHPYPDLCIGFHTGIKIGAYYGYNGTRFYNNSDWATQIFSVGDGDNNVRVYYDIRTPLMYDMNNTGYYWDGNNETRMYRSEAQYGWGTWVQYDANDASYYVDPASTSRYNYLGRNYGWNWVEYDWNDGNYYTDLNGGSRFNYLGRNYGWNWTEYDWNDGQYYMDLNNVSIVNDMRARIFYDYDNTGYYCNPNGWTILSLLQTYDATYLSRYGSQTWIGDQSSATYTYPYDCGYYVYYSCGWWNYSSCAYWQPQTCYASDYNERLRVNGRAYSYSWANLSDGRLKTNIGTINNALEMVTSMRGVTYDWKTVGQSHEQVIKNADKEYVPQEDVKAEKLKSHTGFIAQEIQTILPSAVSKMVEKDSAGNVIDTILGVDYIVIIPVLVEAIKEQQKQIDELKALLGVSSVKGTDLQTSFSPPADVQNMTAGISDSKTVSVAEAVKLLEDNLQFMTKEHQEQMKDFINEIKTQNKLNPDQLSKVLEFRNNIREFQKNK